MCGPPFGKDLAGQKKGGCACARINIRVGIDVNVRLGLNVGIRIGINVGVNVRIGITMWSSICCVRLGLNLKLGIGTTVGINVRIGINVGFRHRNLNVRGNHSKGVVWGRNP